MCDCPEHWVACFKQNCGRATKYRWPKVTPEQVQKIDKVLAPEFATGDWQTVERE